MGLIRGVARTAVVAGTATAVSNRVSRRQAGRWAAQEQQYAPQEQYPPQQYAAPQQQYAPAQQYAPEYADPVAQQPGGMDAKLAQLKELGTLREQGGADRRGVRGPEGEDPRRVRLRRRRREPAKGAVR
ncbi:SHOCT domain-containing protein [Georgenia sp. SUBG003]|uniref:SHOCT domain-containing protein n=1 Tax=Georgenia sp. SUBG003 TaxID=1497974 RepID=UPI000A8620A4